MNLEQWTPDLVRELLTVVYGGTRDEDGRWHPDIAQVARRRRVARSTVRRWISGAQLAIPPARLEPILRRRRPLRRVLHQEELQHRRNLKLLERAALGRGRGNLQEYAGRGWLDQHLVLVLEDPERPLRRIAIVRDQRRARQDAARGARIVDVTLADTKFAAEQVRHEILTAVEPWRVVVPPPGKRGPGTERRGRGHTQTWLASAPLPPTPLQVRTRPDA